MKSVQNVLTDLLVNNPGILKQLEEASQDHYEAVSPMVDPLLRIPLAQLKACLEVLDLAGYQLSKKTQSPPVSESNVLRYRSRNST